MSARRRAEARLAWWLCLPAVAAMLAVTAFPILYAGWLSLFRYDLRFPAARTFVGLDNYASILGSEVWWSALANTLIVIATLEVAQAILLEAALSFLGLGVRPPMPSWGLMIAEGREHILFDPWLIAFPGMLICVLVLAINLLGDGLRDTTAPATRG